MDLVTTSHVAHSESDGCQQATLVAPTNIRVLTTGAEGTEWLNTGPTHGKQWLVTVWVRIEESDL